MSPTMEIRNVSGAAEYFGVSNCTIYRWVKSGKLPATRVGWELLFTQENLDSLGGAK